MCGRAGRSRMWRSSAIRSSGVNGRVIRLGDIATIKRGYTDPPEPIHALRQPSGTRHRCDDGTDGVMSLRSGKDFGCRDGAALPRCAASRPQARAGCEYARGGFKRSVDDFVEAVAEGDRHRSRGQPHKPRVTHRHGRGHLDPVGIGWDRVVHVSVQTSGCHKVSLGTLILALGLLVDDAIIAVETMAVKLEQGFDRLRAGPRFAYSSTAFPMFDRYVW